MAFVGYLVCGWGDALGEPVGTRWGKHRYRVPSLAGVPATRSLEGSSAVFLAGAMAAFLGLALAGVAPITAALVALAAGLTGAVVEAFSTHGLDNLTVQVAAAAAAFFLL
jgi:phytol kinase